MDIKVLNNSNLTSLSAVYPDSSITLTNSKQNSYNGINLTLNNLLSAVNDTTINNYSLFYLSDNTRYSNYLTVSNLPTPTNYTFTSYIATSTANTVYLAVDSSTESAATITFVNALADNTYFEINFLDDRYCKIKNTENNITRYLSYDYVNGVILMLADESGISFNDISTFEYVLDLSSNTVVFSKKVFGKTQYLTFNFSNYSLGFEIATDHDRIIPFKNTQIFKLRINTNSVVNTLSTSNYVYEQSLDNTKLTVDKTKSTYDFSSNFLFNSEYFNINPYASSTYSVNILNLKNQKTVFNTQSQGGVFKTQPAFNHRYYHDLYTGVSQETGNSNIGLGFASYTLSTVLKSDSLNYFHVPYDIYPYEKLNVNDSSLVISGAIASDTPYYSDKIFKKLGNYMYSSPYGNVSDTQTGAYLCTWLSGSNDINGLGVWVDRFYNPTNVSYYDALVNPSTGVTTDFERISSSSGLDYNEYDIFDTTSNLTFEKGSLYAYHHVGNKNCQTFVDKLSTSVIVDNFDYYYTKTYIRKQYVNEIIFDHDNFTRILTTPLDYVSTFDNFSITFDISNENWLVPFGSQIVGNYSNRGFGIFNYRKITPYSLAYTGNKISVFNTQGKLIRDIYADDNIISIQKSEPNSTFLVFDDQGYVSKYNYIGTTLDKKLINQLVNNTTASFYSYGDYVFILIGIDWYRLNIHSLSIQSSSELVYGVTLIGELTDAKSIVATADNVYILSGYNPKVYNNEIYFYNQPQLFYYNIDSAEYGIKVEAEIQDYTFDNNGSFYALYDDTSIVSINNVDVITYSAKLSSITNFEHSYGKTIDLIDEFYGGDHITDRLSILSLSSTSDNINYATAGVPVYTRTSTDFSTSNSTIVDNIIPIASYNGNQNFNNYDYLRNNYDSGETIQVKVKLPNIYDVQTFETASITYPLSNISPGYHNITVVFNTVDGYLNMLIDGKNAGVYTFNPGQYSYGTIFDNALYIGTESGYGNDKLNDDLNDTNYYNYGKFKMKNMYVYNVPLYTYDVVNIIRSKYNIEDLVFELPTGKRNYVENIGKFFMNKLPGRKSNLLNIGIQDTGITQQLLQYNINREIVGNIQKVLPSNTQLNNIVWETDNE